MNQSHLMYKLSQDGSALNSETLLGWKDELLNYLYNPSVWVDYGVIILKIILICIAGWIIKRIALRAINHLLVPREKSPIHLNPRRAKTLFKLAANVVSYVLNFMVIMLVLNQMGFDLAPLLAGAGVIGLAIGFGAQSLVKDVITGFFIIFEDQFAVGDVVQIGAFKGTVEEIGIRVTRIRNWTGEVHIIPNGSILQVTNYSVNNSMAVLDITIGTDVDLEATLALIKQTMKNSQETSDKIVKEPKVLGVQSMSPTEIVIRIIAECKPNAHFSAARIMNVLIKNAFDEKGLKFKSQTQA